MAEPDTPTSRMDTSSIREGRRQSLCPARVNVGQYATAAAQVYVAGAAACCHMSSVTLSVTVPSPLSVYASAFGAPAATSTGPFGMGHSAQVGSTQAGVEYRSQSNPVPQAEVLRAVQPLAAAEQVVRLRPAHWVTPIVQAFVQHEAAPAAPLHIPPAHVEDDDW